MAPRKNMRHEDFTSHRYSTLPKLHRRDCAGPTLPLSFARNSLLLHDSQSTFANHYCPDLDWIPTKIVPKPGEFGVYPTAWRDLGVVPAVAIENYRRLILAPQLAREAARFARAEQVDVIWAVLQGQTILRVAARLAGYVRKPLVSQVWDPLSWWLRAHNVDLWNQRLGKRQFDVTIRLSTACLTGSWAMADAYRAKYHIPCVPILASYDPAIAAPAARRLQNDRELVIGMAGQFYAQDEWNQLVLALTLANWRIAGRSVRLKVLGMYPPTVGGEAERMEFVGWKSQEQAIKILSEETDILYCPYPFEPVMEEVARLSFPSKLPLYFAAGRPVVSHGPDYSSPACYLRQRRAAVISSKIFATAIYNELQRVVEDQALYESIVRNARTAFLEDFTIDRMRKCFTAAFSTMRI